MPQLFEKIRFEQPTNSDGRVQGQLRFYDGSTLVFEEKTVKRGRNIIKVVYRYHYQQADGTLAFRYDNAPHHPDVSTYPDHVHVGKQIKASAPPDLSDVLRRIDEILYPHNPEKGV
ncbi:MAG: hypothetical protein DRI77_02375 [Chloroflexi bacterium]|nr:MAG: hypothetical protein DRI77_02375 [Chloroflexota bacterium]